MKFLRICDKYQNAMCWPISILFVCSFGAEVFGWGRRPVKGTGDGLNLEGLVLVVV